MIIGIMVIIIRIKGVWDGKDDGLFGAIAMK